MTEVHIVRASEADVEQIAPLFDAYRQFYRAESNPEGAHAYLQERLRRQEAVVFLAMINHQAAGFTLLYPLFGSIVMRPIWLLNDLFVVPHARKQGVGHALLERARQFGIETGAQRLQLSTEVTNTTAQSVYEAHGWKRETEYYSYRLYLE